MSAKRYEQYEEEIKILRKLRKVAEGKYRESKHDTKL